MYITQLLADAFVTLIAGVITALCAIWLGCPANIAPFIGLSVGLAAYSCRVSTEALMLAEYAIAIVENGVKSVREED